MPSVLLVVSSSQLTPEDSHFYLSSEFTKGGLKVYIADVDAAVDKYHQYREDFSPQGYKTFFDKSHHTEQRLPRNSIYIPRIDPPIPVYRAAMIACATKNIMPLNEINGVLLSQSKAILPFLFPEFGQYRIVEKQEDLLQLLNKFPDLIVKPLEGFGGKGVARIKGGHFANLSASEFSLPALAMPFLSEIFEGERRIFVVDGRAVGALMKYPAPNSWLTNIAQGGRPEPTDLNEDDKRLANVAARRLRQFGIRFFAVDTVGQGTARKIIEINVSNPGGINLVDKCNGGSIAAALTRALTAIPRHPEMG